MNILFALQGILDEKTKQSLPHICDAANKANGCRGDATILALNIAFSVIAAIAILIIVLSGMRHAFARDNPENISKARNSVVYAVIGLVIVASAAAIVNLVIGRLGK